MNEKRFVYLFDLTVDLGTVIPEIQEITKSLNATLATCGHTEQVAITQTIGSLEIKITRELTPQEEEEVRKLIENQYRAELPQWNIRIASPRRQSGKAPQSAS